jgi:hypothetical protein
LAPEPAWMLWSRENLAMLGIKAGSSKPLAPCYTDWAIPTRPFVWRSRNYNSKLLNLRLIRYSKFLSCLFFYLSPDKSLSLSAFHILHHFHYCFPLCLSFTMAHETYNLMIIDFPWTPRLVRLVRPWIISMDENKVNCARISMKQWQWDCYKSVARIRLVKTENHSVCATLNCKVCRSETALYCLLSRVVWMYKVQ